jgi:hypothetical protein
MSALRSAGQAMRCSVERSLMLALRAIVAADGQHPVPSSREHASASVSSARRSFT